MKFSQYTSKETWEKLMKVYIHNHGFFEVENNTWRILATAFESKFRVK